MPFTFAQLNLELTCGSCPVQYEGQLFNGDWMYFRSRHNAWECNIAPTLDEAVENQGSFHAGGDYGIEHEDAGYMPHALAEKIIADCVNIYADTLAPAAV